MKLRNLREFLVLADSLDLSIAARKIGTASPNLLRHMRELEGNFGVKLFEAKPGGIRLTEAGTRLVPSARALVEKMSSIYSELHNMGSGWRSLLRVGFIEGAMNEEIVQSISALKKRHTDLQVIPAAMSPVAQLNELRAGRLDIAVIGHPGGDVHRHFDLFNIGRLTLRLIMPVDHPLTLKRSVPVEDLRDLPFVGMNESLFPGRQAFISRVCEGGGFKPHFAAIVDSPSSMLTTVGANGMFGMAPDTAWRIDHAGAEFRAIDSEFAYIDCCAAVAKGESRVMVTRFLNQMRADHAAAANAREQDYQERMDRLHL